MSSVYAIFGNPLAFINLDKQIIQYLHDKPQTHSTLLYYSELNMD